MKPILPKTVINGSGLPQVCSVLATPGTTIILAPPFMRGALGESHQSISLPASTIAVGSQNVTQPTPVILPLAATKFTQCPTVLSKLGSEVQQISPSFKTDRFRKVTSKKEKAREGINLGLKKSNVKNILPKVSQVDTPTLIIIPHPAPTFLSNASLSSSSVLSSRVALKPNSTKKCKILPQKNKSFIVDVDRNPQREREHRKKVVNLKSVSASNREIKMRKSKVNSKDVRKSKCNQESTCSKAVGINVRENTKVKLNDMYHEGKANISAQGTSKDLALKPNDLFLSEQDIPYHPPPPYPCLLDEKSDVTSDTQVKQGNKEKGCFPVQLSDEESSPVIENLHGERQRNPSTPTQYGLFESSNSVSCDVSSSYQTCSPSVPSESFTCPTKLGCSDYTANSFANHMSEAPQQNIQSLGVHHPDNSATPCSYTRMPTCSMSSYKSRSFATIFSRSTTPSMDPPSYSSSPHPVKYPSSVPSTHLPSAYPGNYNPSSAYSHSPSNHSPNVLPQSSSSLASAGSQVHLSSSSPHTEVQGEMRRVSTSEDLGPPASPSLPPLSNATTPHSCNQLIHECSHSYVTKTGAPYPVSPVMGPLPYSSQAPYHTSSHQASPYTTSLTPASYSQSPQTSMYATTRSPQPNSYVAPPHSTLYDMSPQASAYTQSPQQNFYSPSPQQSSSSYSHQQISYQSSQEMSHSVSMQHSTMRVSSQSPQSVRHHFANSQGYSDSPHPTSYCQSPESTPTIARHTPNDLGKDCQSALLPPYSFPHLPSSSQYITNSTNMYTSSHNNHSDTVDEPLRVEGNKTLHPVHQPYCNDKFITAGLPGERCLSPPSYEAHFQNTLSFSTASHPSSSAHDHLYSQQQSTPENYSLYHHASRYDEQDVSSMHMNPKDDMRAPPAYPAVSTSSLSLPPPRYMSDPHSASGSHVNYPFTPDMCSESQEYSPLEHSGNFFPNTPPMMPLPAAPPPMENQFSLPSASTSQGLSATHSASYSTSFASAAYLSHDYEDQEFEEPRPYKTVDQERQSEHHAYEVATNANSSRGGSGENAKVHDLIERAERLWFIPHQGQNRVYMKRKELAKDFLNHSVSKSSRDTLLKEKFWIDEDEPISSEIVNSSCGNDYIEEEQHRTDEVLYNYEHGNQVSEGKNASSSGDVKTKKNMEMLCQICGKILKGRSSLKSHLNSHHSIQPHACPYCSKSFSSRSVLVQHLRIHTGEKPYACPICDRAFRTRTGLKRHKSMHTDVRPFECSMCSKAFKTKIVLQQHLKLHLTGLFTCPVCNKTFEKHKSFVVHKASHHHNTKRFRCTHCSKGYRFRSLLNHHMQMHANIRKNVCPVCSEAFVWRSGLAAHMKTHSTSRPKCDICGACFLSEKRLETHYKRHSNKKPHRCEECGHSFAHAYRLASHKMVHQERREFSCPKCGLVFSSMKKMKKHSLCHKKDEGVLCQPSGSVTS